MQNKIVLNEKNYNSKKLLKFQNLIYLWESCCPSRFGLQWKHERKNYYIKNLNFVISGHDGPLSLSLYATYATEN